MTEVDRPSPGPGEVLVRISATSVNPTDLKARASGGLLGAPPFTLGADVSGVVAGLGMGVRLFELGAAVFGMPNFPKPAATYAEYVTAPAHHFALKPAELSHREAAALPLVGLTAWQALVEIATVESGQTVLIHGGSGGVGHVAIQIAKARGAHVLATASGAKHDFVLGLGADRVLDYRADSSWHALSDVDVVIDTVGGDTRRRSLDILRPGGTLVSLAGPDEDGLVNCARQRGVHAGFMLVAADRRGLLALAGLVGRGSLRPTVGCTFPLDQIVEAHHRAASGTVTGKIVIDVG